MVSIVISTISSSELSSKLTIPVMDSIIKTFDELIVAQTKGNVQIYSYKNSIYLKRIKVCWLILQQINWLIDFVVISQLIVRFAEKLLVL